MSRHKERSELWLLLFVRVVNVGPTKDSGSIPIVSNATTPLKTTTNSNGGTTSNIENVDEPRVFPQIL